TREFWRQQKANLQPLIGVPMSVMIAGIRAILGCIERPTLPSRRKLSFTDGAEKHVLFVASFVRRGSACQTICQGGQ
ncbi:hypothetical protein, partial [Bradyrhizobium sp.]|uniref:hypothetical protein n=1 Tax=Bradyrhizobium sp. TaxID=376 RepID=UPI0025C3043A